MLLEPVKGRTVMARGIRGSRDLLKRERDAWDERE
jgi:hypothetical protein